MRVLTLLLSRRGQVVSRNEIFETVWKNQIVGDDVLTRSISDIRAELGRLSVGDKHIETIPKRGYRWVGDVGESSSSDIPRPEQAAEQASRGGGDALRPRLRGRFLKWLGRGTAYVVAFVATASIGVWLIDQLTAPGPAVIAVLPMPGEPADRELAAGIDKAVSDYLLRRQGVRLLSRTAIESRPSNPFPYFHSEFGARWLVESELRGVARETLVTIALVDARSGIVLFQSTGTIGKDDAPPSAAVEPIIRPLAEFIDAQRGL